MIRTVCFTILAFCSLTAVSDESMSAKELASGIKQEFLGHLENTKQYFEDRQTQNTREHGDDAIFHTLGDAVTDGSKNLFELGKEAAKRPKRLQNEF
jgi:hypothetical protein